MPWCSVLLREDQHYSLGFCVLILNSYAQNLRNEVLSELILPLLLIFFSESTLFLQLQCDRSLQHQFFFPDFGIYDSFTNCDFRIKVNFCKAGKDTKQRINRKRTFKRERICKSRNSKPRKYYQCILAGSGIIEGEKKFKT